MVAVAPKTARPNPHGKAYGPPKTNAPKPAAPKPAASAPKGKASLPKPKIPAKVAAKMGRLLAGAARLAAKTPLTVAALCVGVAAGAAIAYATGAGKIIPVNAGKKGKGTGPGPKANVAPLRHAPPPGPKHTPGPKPGQPGPGPAKPGHSDPKPPGYKPDVYKPSGPQGPPSKVALPPTPAKTNQDRINEIAAEENIRQGHQDATNAAAKAEAKLGQRNVDELKKRHSENLARFTSAKMEYLKQLKEWSKTKIGPPPVSPNPADFGL